MKITVLEMINEVEFLYEKEERKAVKNIYRNTLKQLRQLPRDKMLDKDIILNGIDKRIELINAGA